MYTYLLQASPLISSCLLTLINNDRSKAPCTIPTSYMDSPRPRRSPRNNVLWVKATYVVDSIIKRVHGTLNKTQTTSTANKKKKGIDITTKISDWYVHNDFAVP